MSGELEKLAQRVEELTEPCRMVDAEIFVAIDVGRDNLDALAINGEVGTWVPAYTASLDAAMRLVPEGQEWSVFNPANADGSKSVFGYPSRCYAFVAGGDREHNYAATPALALASAALRASPSGGE